MFNHLFYLFTTVHEETKKLINYFFLYVVHVSILWEKSRSQKFPLQNLFQMNRRTPSNLSGLWVLPWEILWATHSHSRGQWMSQRATQS